MFARGPSAGNQFRAGCPNSRSRVPKKTAPAERVELTPHWEVHLVLGVLLCLALRSLPDRRSTPDRRSPVSRFSSSERVSFPDRLSVVFRLSPDCFRSSPISCLRWSRITTPRAEDRSTATVFPWPDLKSAAKAIYRKPASKSCYCEPMIWVFAPKPWASALK